MDKPIKIIEYDKKDHNDKRIVYLLPMKESGKWKFVNLTKEYGVKLSNIRYDQLNDFSSRDEALKDFVKYANKFYKVEFEEM